MNEILRRAILGAGLDEIGVAAHLEVDPKTVRRWLEGRLPYTRHRWALVGLLNVDETDLWPELRSTRTSPIQAYELQTVYPHRSSIPRETWRNLFASAEHEIAVVDYSSLFLAEDIGLLHIFAEKARSGVRVRIALVDPKAPQLNNWVGTESIASSTANMIHPTSTLCEHLMKMEGFEIRLHHTALYNSIYRADSDLLISQHVYGIEFARSPIMHLRMNGSDGIASTYIKGFENIWSNTEPLPWTPT